MSFIPHLVEFHEKYSDKGLAIIAITSDDKAVIEKFAKEKGITYPVAFDPSRKVGNVDYGVTGIPHGFLLDPKGVVVWEGHPASLQVTDIEEQLKRADVFSLREVDKSLAKAAEAFKKGLFAAAQKSADEILKKKDATETQKTDAQYILDEIKGVAERKMASAKEAAEAKRFLSAQEDYGFLADHFKGTDTEKEAKDALKALLADPAAKKEIEAAKALKNILEHDGKIKNEKSRRATMMNDLKAFLAKYKDTDAAKQAEEQLNSLK